MATIIKRKKNYSIVYNYVDEDGNSKQKWETRSSYQDALKRKTEIESQKVMGNFIPPSNQTISEFLEDFVSLYGEKRWGLSMYDSQNSLIANYINPIIGDLKVQDINARVVDKYIQTLQKTPAVSTRTHHAKTTLVTNATIQKIIKLLRCAFKQAVRWELIGKNPFDNVVLPKTEYKNGRPCEDRIMLKEFEKLRESAGLPKVVFHSLRHSSTTYKLKLNNGDLKATQGDTGHAQIDMITNVYAHILDEDRKIGAQKFESAFYARPEERTYAKPDLRTVHPPQEEKAPASDLDTLLDQLRKSPELASTLASLLGAVTAGKQV